MNNKQISQEHSEQILEKMFNIIGLEFDKNFIKQENWYQKNTWTKEQEQEFIVWLANFLVKNKYVLKSIAKHEAEKIVGQYGWKTRNVL